MQPTFPLLLALLALTGSVLCDGDTDSPTTQSPTSPTTTVQPTTTTTNNGVVTTTTAGPASATTSTTTKPSSNTLLVKALRVENPSGKVADGQPCSEFDFAGVPCKMQITFGAALNSADCKAADSGVPVYGNSADLDYNAIEIPQNAGVFAGFAVCATLTTVDGSQITTFSGSVDASQQQGIMTLTQPSGASVKFAWKSHVPPATPAPPTTTQTTMTTNSATEGPKGTTPEPIFAKDCDDFDDRVSGVRTVHITNETLDVYCQYGATNGSLMVIQSRGDNNNVSFDIPVEEYEKHFGESGIGKNFWLGLENMNNLTNTRNYNLFIEVCCGTGVNGTQQYYTNFTIGSKEEGYVLKATAIGQAIGRGLDLQSPNTQMRKDIGQKFSTYDTYNATVHDDPEYCEVLHQEGGSYNSTGGWWFGNCANNLNGAYLKANDSSTCQLSSTQLQTEGTGIEFKLDPGFDPAGNALSGRTFTRVRMAVYRAEYPLIGFPTNSFCS